MVDLDVDEHAGQAARLEQVALELAFGEVVELHAAEALEVDSDAIGARLGDDAVEDTTTMPASQACLTAPFSAVGDAELRTIAS